MTRLWVLQLADLLLTLHPRPGLLKHLDSKPAQQAGPYSQPQWSCSEQTGFLRLNDPAKAPRPPSKSPKTSQQLPTASSLASSETLTYKARPAAQPELAPYFYSPWSSLRPTQLVDQRCSFLLGVHRQTAAGEEDIHTVFTRLKLGGHDATAAVSSLSERTVYNVPERVMITLPTSDAHRLKAS